MESETVGFGDMLKELDLPVNDEQENGSAFNPEISDIDEEEEPEPEYAESQQSDRGGEEPEPEESEMTDKELANLLSVIVDIVFSVTWGFVSQGDSRDYKMNADARKDLATAFIPVVGTWKSQLSPEWLLLITLLALQLGNGVRAFEAREEILKNKKAKTNRKKYSEAEEVEVEILDEEGNPIKEYGRDHKKHPKTKKCGQCGKFGHNKATCPENPKNKATIDIQTE